jgi:hypothetical protein
MSRGRDHIPAMEIVLSWPFRSRVRLGKIA